MNQIIFSSI